MNAVLIIAHAPLAKALREGVLHCFPDAADAVAAVDIQAQAEPEASLAQAQNALAALASDEVLVLTDIFGATPCNAARKMVVPGKVAMLTGLNAPMLIKAVQYAPAATDLAAFTENVRQAAINGIIAITTPPEEGC